MQYTSHTKIAIVLFVATCGNMLSVNHSCHLHLYAFNNTYQWVM